MPSQSRERSVSGDLESSDAGSPGDGNDNPSAAGKPGRKKNPNSQAARRDQNRIAQREFRLRKQQRIRDLEASVEMLSGGKDEALTQIRKIMKDLMQENQALRNLLRNLSAFIGEGAGGLLPKLGWDMNDFNNFVNRSETDTAWESYQRHKKEDQTNGASSSSAGGQKRALDDDPHGLRPKRQRGDQNGEGDRDGYPLLALSSTVPPPPPGNGMYSSSTRSSHENALFSDLMRGPSSGSPIVNSAHNSYPPSYMPPMNINPESLPSMPVVNSGLSVSQARAASSSSQTPTTEDPEMDPKRQEAMKLIHYHLDNYKRNSAYCLPSSLRPTLVQRTVPHESVIDSILHPELRDRMILLRGRFDLVDCLHDYRTAVIIHGDDVLAHSNWEITETWLQRYKFLVDPATLTITNRWRRERGESELRMADFASAEPHATAT